MKWLIICSPTQNSGFEEVKSLVESFDVSVSKFVYGEETNSSLFSVAAECDYCICLPDEVSSLGELSPELTYVIGYFMGKEIPFFYVLNNNNEKIIPLSSDSCYGFKSVAKLKKSLKERFPQFLEKEKQKHARQALLAAGIPFNPDSFAFHIASNNCSECNLFIDSGIDVNSRDASGTPMLCIAARHNRKEMIEQLLSLGADINAVSKDRGYSPVMDAVWKSNAEIVEFLVSKGADLSCISRDGQPVLVLAVGTGNEKICRILVEYGASPSVCDSMGMSALAYAKLFKKNELVAMFEAAEK